MAFVHLHNHTEFSLLDGFQHINRMVTRAVELGQSAVAITDHGSLAGTWGFAQECKRRGVKPILGQEIYLCVGGQDRFSPKSISVDASDDVDGGDNGQEVGTKTKRYEHLTVLARTPEGWRNLVRANNAAQNSFYMKPLWDYDLLAEHGEGLIVLTGCLGGPVAGPLSRQARLLVRAEDAEGLASSADAELAEMAEARYAEVLGSADAVGESGKQQRAALETQSELHRRRAQGYRQQAEELGAEARRNLERIIDAVGRENVYVELMYHGIDAEKSAIVPLRDLAREYSLPMVVTGDCHYTHEHDAETHEAWLADQSGRTLDDPRAFKFNGDGYHLKSEDEIRGLFPKSPTWQEACDETSRLAERIDDWVLPEAKLRLPTFPLVPAEYGEDHSAYFYDLIKAGAKERYGTLTPEVKKRLRHEFDVIESMGVVDYFLIVWEMIGWARSQGILVGPGRGCLKGDTPVWTTNGFKQIRDIRIGDIVRSHTGTLREVENTFRYECDEELVTIKSATGGPGITMTADHKVLVRRADTHEWVPAVEVRSGDLLCIPLPEKVQWPPAARTSWTRLEDGTGVLVVNTAATAAGVCEYLWAEGFAAGVEPRGARWGVFAKPQRSQDLDFIYVEARSITPHRSVGEVFDIQVEVDHSFMTDAFVVHNSAAGAVVSYALGITNVEPLANGLLFERFLEPGRVGMPDIDVDFEQDRVPEVHQHLRDVYGHDHVAQLGTFQIARTKNALKSSGKVLGKSALGQRLSNTIPVQGGRPASFASVLDESNPMGEDFRKAAKDPEAQALVRHAVAMENMVRNWGIHACGVIVSAEDLTDLIPLRKLPPSGLRKDASRDEVNQAQAAAGWITQWDGRACEEFGLLKLDALSLRNLDICTKTVALIAQDVGEQVDLNNLPHPDELSNPRVRKAYELLAHGLTSGIFQVTSQGMTELVVSVQPRSLADLTAIGALYRPGPMASGSHTSYAARKNGLEEVSYRDLCDTREEAEILASIFGETYALITYQEQLMILAGKISGFSGAESSKLRKAMGKKSKDAMRESMSLFRERATRDLVGEDGAVSIAFKSSSIDKLERAIWACAEYVFNKCISGDARLETERGARSDSERWTVERLYNRLYGDESVGAGICMHCGERPAGPSRKCQRCRSWLTKFSDQRGFRILAYSPADGRIRPEQVKDVHRNGIKPVLEVKTEDGRSVKVTSNHRLLGLDGWVEAGNLAVGDSLITHGGFEQQKFTAYRLSAGERTPRPGKAGQSGELNRGYIDGGSMKLKEWTAATVATAACVRCGKSRAEGRLERAHLDGNRTNNDPSNLSWMCVSHHKAHDYRFNARNCRWSVGHSTIPSKIVSITQFGEEMTYDVEMAEGTNHNFLANGIVSHNSHSAAYGLVTFMTAYLKANWPAHYAAATLMQTDDKDKRNATLAALASEGISVLPPDVNEGLATTSVAGPGAIRLGLGEIAGVKDAGRMLVEERERRGPFRDMADLIRRLPGVTSLVLRALVDSGATDCLGDRPLSLATVYTGTSTLPLIWGWGVLESSARQRQVLGLSLGKHPMDAYAAELSSQRHPGVPGGKNLHWPPALRVSRLMHSKTTGGTAVVYGVLTAFAITPYSKGKLARWSLEDSDGSNLSGVMWDQDLAALDELPAVGQIVTVTGQLKVRVVGGHTVDERGNEIEAEPTTQLEMTAKRFFTINLEEPQTPIPNAAPMFDWTEAFRRADSFQTSFG